MDTQPGQLSLSMGSIASTALSTWGVVQLSKLLSKDSALAASLCE